MRLILFTITLTTLDLNDGLIFVAMRWQCDGDGLFLKRCDSGVFWTNVTTATIAINWTQPSLTMFFDIMVFKIFGGFL